MTAASDALTRRRFLVSAGAFAITNIAGYSTTFAETTEAGRLRIPTIAPTATTSLGLQKLGGRNGSLYIPASYRVSEPRPLLVLLHKAAGNCSEWFRASPKGPQGAFAAHADAERFVILAPEALGETWGSGGPKSWGYDYESINRALEAAFGRCAIDRSRLAIGGFSDGASYALSLGLTNGDLFGNVIAFSPGYIVRAPGRGRPSLFIAHGVGDPVLPIAVTSRIFVASLRKNGYHIEFREFSGGHALLPEVAEEAMSWLKRDFRQR